MCGDSYACNYEDHPITVFDDSDVCAVDMCDLFFKVGGDPTKWFGEFVREKRIHEGDSVYHDLYGWVRALDLAGTYDQLNVGGCAVTEHICRTIHSYVDAYSDPDHVDWSDAKYYTTTGKAPSEPPSVYISIHVE